MKRIKRITECLIALPLALLLALSLAGCSVADAWEESIFFTSVNATTVNTTQLTATTGNISENLTVTGNATISNLYHTDVYGTTYKLFASGGVPTGYGYVSAFYFGQNNGDATSNASFQGAFGVNNLQNSGNLSEGNWAFGDAVMQNGTALRYNIGIGDGAIRWLTSSNNTVAVGNHVIYAANATGFSRVLALGAEASRNTYEGTNYVILGSLAGYSAERIHDSFIGGTLAVGSGLVVNNSTIIGYRAGQAAPNLTDTIAIGTLAGNLLNGGTFNIILGNLAGQVLVNNSRNILIGHGAGNQLTDDDNVFVGYFAGVSATTSQRNVVIGANTTASVLTGDQNVVLGYGSGRGLTSGASNLFLGNSAGNDVTTGTRNLIIGADAGSAVGLSGAISNLFMIDMAGDTINNAYLTGNTSNSLTTRTLTLGSASATAGNTKRSFSFTLRSHYWNGTNTLWDYVMTHNMTNNVTASSNVTFSTNGTSWLIGENLGGTVGVFISVNGTISKVYAGAADTGGTGYKMLIIPN